eukprot:TRINITY_DN113292_c0_g1_i1.p1 TRINITY_DN113292_c0_g1~~TRINITY_DN113292_c0_g1_i1.p1  ORF type:complete len:297 (-),score=20.00 TRINITY_DN113292_c0_g1_i1:3-806(-)
MHSKTATQADRVEKQWSQGWKPLAHNQHQTHSPRCTWDEYNAIVNEITQRITQSSTQTHWWCCNIEGEQWAECVVQAVLNVAGKQPTMALMLAHQCYTLDKQVPVHCQPLSPFEVKPTHVCTAPADSGKLQPSATHQQLKRTCPFPLLEILLVSCCEKLRQAPYACHAVNQHVGWIAMLEAVFKVVLGDCTTQPHVGEGNIPNEMLVVGGMCVTDLLENFAQQSGHHWEVVVAGLTPSTLGFQIAKRLTPPLRHLPGFSACAKKFGV